jgi:F420-non-reducing hydrogenase iron-sulfur subunit
MCTGRVDLAFVLRAFSQGADGVFIAGCWPGECHYITEGNYDALGNTHIGRRLLTHLGLRPERLRLEWIAASEGARFAETTTSFVSQVKELGPLGEEGPGAGAARRGLEAANGLVPYLKLVERERWRVPVKSQAAYDQFFGSEEFQRLFDEAIADPLAAAQIMTLLAEGPLSTGRLSELLGLSASEVSRHLNRSSRQGLVRYDPDRGCYALA